MLPKTDRLYLTVIDQEAEGDTYFPTYDEFTKVIEDTPGNYGNLNYSYLVLEK
jgi:dihydrofolate reductase